MAVPGSPPPPPIVQQLLVVQGLIVEASRSHTPQTVGLLWTSDQTDAETSTWQYTTLTRDSHLCPQQDSNPPVLAVERPQTHAFDREATGIGSTW